MKIVDPPQEETCTKDTRSHLDPQMYGEFAETVVSLAMYARNKAHVDFEYFGPVNETDCYPAEGPRIDPDEMPKLLTAVASRLRKEGLGRCEVGGSRTGAHGERLHRTNPEGFGTDAAGRSFLTSFL